MRVQSAITLEDSEPEPDIAVVLGPEERYLEAHPTAPDIGLTVEVADTTLRLDGDFKDPLYARAKIPIYWIVNLVDM